VIVFDREGAIETKVVYIQLDQGYGPGTVRAPLGRRARAPLRRRARALLGRRASVTQRRRCTPVLDRDIIEDHCLGSSPSQG
jgi:hypothetical protein